MHVTEFLASMLTTGQSVSLGSFLLQMVPGEAAQAGTLSAYTAVSSAWPPGITQVSHMVPTGRFSLSRHTWWKSYLKTPYLLISTLTNSNVVSTWLLTV